jgi:hypothetical protein
MDQADSETPPSYSGPFQIAQMKWATDSLEDLCDLHASYKSKTLLPQFLLGVCPPRAAPAAVECTPIACAWTLEAYEL